jgi:hypothetical protein
MEMTTDRTFCGSITSGIRIPTAIEAEDSRWLTLAQTELKAIETIEV